MSSQTRLCAHPRTKSCDPILSDLVVSSWMKFLKVKLDCLSPSYERWFIKPSGIQYPSFHRHNFRFHFHSIRKKLKRVFVRLIFLFFFRSRLSFPIKNANYSISVWWTSTTFVPTSAQSFTTRQPDHWE